MVTIIHYIWFVLYIAVLTFQSVTSDLTEARLYMYCRMDFGGNWSTLSIKKKYKNSDTMTPLVSMSSNRSMTLFTKDSGRVSSSYSIGFNYVTLRVSFSPPVCNDEAIYYCFIDESDLNPTTEAELNIFSE